MAHAAMILAQVNATASPFLWYVTRTMAIGAYIALTASVMIGLLRSIGRISGEQVSWVVSDVHAFVSSLTGALVLGHVLTLLVDPYLPFSLRNVLIPGDQPYAAFAVNLGVLALYAMIALLLTSWLRPRLPHDIWRATHYLSFAAFILVTLHGWMAGSDSVTPWMPALYLASSAAIGFLVLVRFFSAERPAAQRTAQPSLLESKVAWSFIIAVLIFIVGLGLVVQLQTDGSEQQTSQDAIAHVCGCEGFEPSALETS
jgi:sulfoxide reductase heme-binding subunit YedZ